MSELLNSTSAKDQRSRILAALRAGLQTSYALRRIGAYQAPTRVLELRRMGFEIVTHRVTLVDRDGFSHQGVALYELIAEPSGSTS